MALDQLEVFMGAMRRLESGSFEGNYRAINRSSGAQGAYQIMPGNWAGWAAQAGIPGADWRDPAAQDAVARFKFIEYYRRYKTWDLVAMAWFSGEGTVARHLRGENVGARSDGNTTVSNYIKLVGGYMTEFAQMAGAPTGSRLGGGSPTRANAAIATSSPNLELNPPSPQQTDRAPWFYPMYLSPDDQLANYFGALAAAPPPGKETGPPDPATILRSILQTLSDGVARRSGSGLEAPPSDRIDAARIAEAD